MGRASHNHWTVHCVNVELILVLFGVVCLCFVYDRRIERARRLCQFRRRRWCRNDGLHRSFDLEALDFVCHRVRFMYLFIKLALTGLDVSFERPNLGLEFGVFALDLLD